MLVIQYVTSLMKSNILLLLLLPLSYGLLLLLNFLLVLSPVLEELPVSQDKFHE